MGPTRVWRVGGQVFRKKLQSDKAAELDVFGLVNHTHPSVGGPGRVSRVFLEPRDFRRVHVREHASADEGSDIQCEFPGNRKFQVCMPAMLV
ncbi:MAG: hypothetical protein DMG49_11630 [Acidobacteria bacterium]|nr:MAG: hypothetical protein DMG49_11630 [Acidobacteriota bacterium]